jgi:UDP-N-acetylglucosamine 2-epimerase
VELVQHGFNKITGSDATQIINNAEQMLNKDNVNFDGDLYGKGSAGEAIVEALLKFF